jgi:hypothetical protein
MRKNITVNDINAIGSSKRYRERCGSGGMPGAYRKAKHPSYICLITVVMAMTIVWRRSRM